MTPSTAIEGSKTFSLALSQKSLAEQCVRVVHILGTPRTKLLRFTHYYRAEKTKGHQFQALKEG